MRDLVAACAAGKVNGQVVLDVDDTEDKTGEADMPIALLPNTGLITLFQLDGNLSKEEFEKQVKTIKGVSYQERNDILENLRTKLNNLYNNPT